MWGQVGGISPGWLIESLLRISVDQIKPGQDHSRQQLIYSLDHVSRVIDL